MTESNVISQFKIKTIEGNETPIPIGPELKYIGSSFGSNNNNLEEQMLMGVDKITTTSYDLDQGAQVTETKFCDNNRESGYYILKQIVYTDPDDKYADTDLALLNFKNKDANLKVENNSLSQVSHDTHMVASINEGNEYILQLKAIGFVEEDTLSYKDNANDLPIDISYKQIIQETDDNDRIVKKEIITKVESN